MHVSASNAHTANPNLGRLPNLSELRLGETRASARTAPSTHLSDVPVSMSLYDLISRFILRDKLERGRSDVTVANGAPVPYAMQSPRNDRATRAREETDEEASDLVPRKRRGEHGEMNEDAFEEWVKRNNKLFSILKSNDVNKSDDCYDRDDKSLRLLKKNVAYLDELDVFDCATDGYMMHIEHNSVRRTKESISADLDAPVWRKLKGATTNEKLRNLWSDPQVARVLVRAHTLCEVLDRNPEKFYLRLLFNRGDRVIQESDISESRGQDFKGAPPPFTRRADRLAAEEAFRNVRVSDYFFCASARDGTEGAVLGFLSVVDSPQKAADIGLPWWGKDAADASASYTYLHMICSTVQGGGMLALNRALALSRAEEHRRLVLSAMPHVLFYYYDVFGARFISRKTGEVVDVESELLDGMAIGDRLPRPMDNKDVADARRRKSWSGADARKR